MKPRVAPRSCGLWIIIGLTSLPSMARTGAASAQFVTPIPRPPSDTVIRVERNQALFYRSLPDSTQDSLRRKTLSTTRIGELSESFCLRQADLEAQAQCRASLNTDTILANTSLKTQSQTKVLLPFRAPLTHDRWALEKYLNSAAGPDGFALFSRFAANVSDDEAYVTSDIITGLAGRVMFAINYAAVVVKDETGDTEAAQRAIENQKANIIRRINNGGTMSARLQLPLFALAGTTGQTASSVYSTFGLVGPTGNTDSLRFAGSVVGELVTARTIREFGEAAGILGQVILGGRIGFAYSEAELLRATRDKGFPFAQLLFGLLQNDKISLSLLYTYPFEERYRGFAPKLTANFAAVR
jgi:hypothetical protein